LQSAFVYSGVMVLIATVLLTTLKLPETNRTLSPH